MLERFHANRPQRFLVTMEVGPWPNDHVIAIPYPIAHPQQTVTALHWQSDGHVVDQRGCLVISNGTRATITATISTQPFRPTTNQLTTQATIRQYYDQTIAKLQYGAPIAGLYSLNDALTLPAVDCGGFSVYLLSLLAQHGITARLVAGFWAGYSTNGMHAWAEALLPNEVWLPLDASTDWLRQHHRTTKLGGFGQIGSDRIVMSVGADHIVRYQQKEYSTKLLQWPIQLLADGTIQYLDRVTTILTHRIK